MALFLPATFLLALFFRGDIFGGAVFDGDLFEGDIFNDDIIDRRCFYWATILKALFFTTTLLIVDIIDGRHF